MPPMQQPQANHSGPMPPWNAMWGLQPGPPLHGPPPPGQPPPPPQPGVPVPGMPNGVPGGYPPPTWNGPVGQQAPYGGGATWNQPPYQNYQGWGAGYSYPQGWGSQQGYAFGNLLESLNIYIIKLV